MGLLETPNLILVFEDDVREPGAFILEKVLPGKLLFRASLAAIPGWVTRTFILKETFVKSRN